MKHLMSITATFVGIVLAILSSSVAAAQTGSPAIKVTEGIVELVDSSLQYYSRGEGEAIVLLPGAILTVGYLDGLAEQLAKAGYRVVGINLRGSGKSTGPIAGVTLQTLADDVAGVIEALKLDPVHVIGNDFGNRVARMLAMTRPNLASSVILLASGGKVAPKPDAGRALIQFLNPKSTNAEVLEAMAYFVAKPSDAAPIWAIIKPNRSPGGASIVETAVQSTPIDTWWAPPGKTPYLILQGADDQIAPPENGELLKKNLGERATLVNVPGAAHFLPVEQPEVTANYVLSFLRQISLNP